MLLVEKYFRFKFNWQLSIARENESLFGGLLLQNDFFQMPLGRLVFA